MPQARNQRHADRLHLTRTLKHFSLVAGDSEVCTSCFRYFSNRCSFGTVENFEHHRIGVQGCSLQLSRIVFQRIASFSFNCNRDHFVNYFAIDLDRRELQIRWKNASLRVKRRESLHCFAESRRVWIGERERNSEWRNEDESMANAARRVVSTRVPNSKMYLKTHAKLHYTVETYSTIVNCKEDNVDTHVLKYTHINMTCSRLHVYTTYTIYTSNT